MKVTVSKLIASPVGHTNCGNAYCAEAQCSCYYDSVFIQGEWAVVRDDAVLSVPNKFGKAIVWFTGVKPDTYIQCFIPGSGV
jgi:hypothetical protein